MGLSLAARGLWVSALSWSCQHRRAEVPGSFLAMVGADDSHADELVDAGLWVAGDRGWTIHDWAQYQDRSTSEKRAEAGAKGGRKSGERRREQAQREADTKQPASNGEAAAEANGKQEAKQVSQPNPTQPKTNTTAPDGASLDASFDEFWTAYPRRNGLRVGRKDACALWHKLTDTDRAEAMAAVVHYGAACDKGLTLAKDAHRWLRGRHWAEWDKPVTPPEPLPEWVE